MRGRALPAACALVVLLLAGCGATRDAPGAGATLTLYAILPLQGPTAARAHDASDGVKLALRQAGGQVGPWAIAFRAVDSSAGGGPPTRRSAAAAAQDPATDPSALGAVGALDAGEAQVELPLLNAGGLALVSPGATYAGLTSARGAVVPGEPARLYPSGTRTFARVVGSDLSQAPALAALARAARCRRLAVLAGPADEERSLAELVAGAVRARGIAVGRVEAIDERRPSPRAGCAFLAASRPDAAARAFRALHRAAPRATLLGPAALADPSFAAALGPAAPAVRLVSPLPAPGSTPGRFAASFTAAFARPPGPYAFLGYDAARALLLAVRRAGARAGDRAAVARALLAGGPRPTVLGPAAFTPAGDPTLAAWARASVRGGRLVLGDRLR